jgi:acyl transferase domain-containing protein/acyl carrier protein/2-polyprenyl-3-methyl-5-hydroxy-6-metoxy-1,4-benzoquinol methylase
MLDVLNRYAHGFVVVPVVLACRKGGVFAALQAAPRAAEALGKELGANLGHLQVALRLIESLGWIDRRPDGRFEANASLGKQRLVPDDLSALIQADMDRYLREGAGGLLAPWIEKVRGRWSVNDELLADFLDSLLVVPVLALLTKRGLLKELPKRSFVDLPEGVRSEVVSLLEALHWLEGSSGHYRLTAPGEFMFERAMNLGLAESYRPMLSAMDQLLFGDAAGVFAIGPDGHEAHVNRAMNVISSGSQHGHYFAEVDAILISIFSREPPSAQPRYVADMGCGDGTFLKHVYETVRDKTPRGKQLADHPLTMIGIDLNQASLDETDRTLSGLDRIIIPGDIGNPKKTIEDLQKAGVDSARILHVRSFLDHDRPYNSPTDERSLTARANVPYLGAYADRNGGSIPAAAVIQSLVEHLSRWAEVINEHGLILLEVHCQDPKVVRAHIDQSESLYFDAIQGFSNQLLVEADAALMAAAEAGLFPRRDYFRKFPAFLPYCRITLNLFERRPYRVRLARPADVPALLRLEEACWPEGMRASGDALKARMEGYALGQWVIEMDGEVVGVVYSQRVADVDRLRECKYQELASLQDDHGSVVQLVTVNVLPAVQHLGLGSQLLELMLMRSALLGGVCQVAGITRCKDFRGQTLRELGEYVEQRNDSGQPVDPILQFHHSHGAKFLGTVAHYRPEDADNLGAGVLLCYDLDVPGTSLQPAKCLPSGLDPTTYSDTKSRLEACLRRLLGLSRQAAFSWKRPLREMGLDSLNLLEFRTLLQQTFGLPFSPTFFFSHPTLLDIRRYLNETVGDSGHAASAPPAARVTLEDNVTPLVGSETHMREAPAHIKGRQELIAVIGMAGQFPGSAGLEGFWDLLRSGRDGVTEIPPERWNVDETYSPDPDAPGKIISRCGGFLLSVDEFDAAFFNISPREAQLMDPQQRLLLELHWEALENAGIDPNRLREAACGIFVGLSSHDYELLQVIGGNEDDLGAHYATGSAASIASGRLAYFLGTRGPAITIDTACSSSLVAMHQAARSLRAGECELAMASGVNLILSPRSSIAFSKARMLSPHGRCRTFDAAADGYVRSEGCGVVVLKRWDDAVRDGDAILAVIRGSAVNQDGASNGLTAPSLPAQEELIRGALKDAGLRPAEIDYLEAHGTGTQLGDPVEFQALRNVFHKDPNRTEPLWLGSVKTNIGHAEAAAGIAGFIKVVMAMQRQWLPAHLHFQKPNSQIALETVPARIPIQGERWQHQDRPLRAGISSFGFSGTNAHVIVEQSPALLAVKPAVGDRSSHLLALSAKSGPALRALMTRYAEWLPDHLDLALADICHTANAGRAHHDYRLAFHSSTHAGLVQLLREGLTRVAEIDRIKGPPKIAFLFTGQGSQYVGMARELSLTEPVFRNALRECHEILADELSQPLETILYPNPGQPSVLDETANTQPALFAVEYALARTLQSWGVEPDAVMGHSVGEYVAACIAGVFSLRDGLKLIAARGRLMQALPRDGAMAAILGRADVVLQTVKEADGKVSVAALNGPANTVISGRRAAVEEIGRRLEQGGAKVVPLHVSHAFHSALMEPILSTFGDLARGVHFSPPKFAFASNLTGDLARDELTTADYWVRHIRQPVQFTKSIRTLVQSGIEIMLEIGPHPVLLAMGQSCLQGLESNSVQWLRTLTRGAADWDGALASLGALYEKGVDVNWSRFDAAHVRRRVSLPTYPWQRKRHWVALSAPFGNQSRSAPSGVPSDWFYEVAWEEKPRTHDPSAGTAARRLPAPAALEARVKPRMADLARDTRLVHSQQALSDIEKLSAQFATAALAGLGFEFSPGQRFSAASIREPLGVLPRHMRLLARMLGMLTEEGVLKQVGGEFEVLATPTAITSAVLAQSTREQHTDNTTEFELLVRCGKKLPAVLRGEEDPLQLLFPVDSSVSAERLYRDSPSARFYNRLVGELVGTAVRDMPRDSAVRLLELGAGTGSTTACVLEELLSVPAEYCFTDVSRSMLNEARVRFEGFSAVRRFAVLDIEKPTDVQKFNDGGFDIVLAANVLHATADLRATLKHVRQLLTPGGLLVLLETTAPRRWLDLVFGLTEGWWRFADTQLRPKHALLGPDKWLALLRDFGFSASTAVGAEFSAGDLHEQTVLLGKTDEPSPAAAGRDPKQTAISAKGRWLVFADAGGLAECVAQSLEHRGGECVLVHAGDQSDGSNPKRLKINLDESDAYRRLVKNGEPWRGVLHAWSLDAQFDEATAFRDLGRAEQLCCRSALWLAQALVKVGKSQSPKLWFLTRGAQPAWPQLKLNSIAQATLWGMGRTLAIEHPELWGGLIDVAPDGDPDLLAQRVAPELYAPDGEDQVAVSENRRLIPRLVTVPPPSPIPMAVKPDVSYLITGGLGGLGPRIARWLVENGARHLILCGRRDLPERDSWGKLVSSHDGYERVKVILELEREGATVRYERIDVADRGQMEALFGRLRDALAPLHGIIHAAADIKFCPLTEMSADALHATLRAKVQGAWLLHELSLGLPLDFFVLFSSATSLFGASRLGHYAASNQFLDFLAHWRRAAGLPALSVNWGAWEEIRLLGGDQDEVGRFGLKPMAAEQALRAMSFLVTGGVAQRMVAEVDRKLLRQAFETRGRQRFFERLSTRRDSDKAPETPGPGWSKVLNEAAPEDRRELLSGLIAGETRRVLGLDATDQINPDRGLFEMGMDSLMSVQLKGRLEKATGYTLPATLTFTYPTVEALTNYLLGQVLKLSSLTASTSRTEGVASEPLTEDLTRLSDEEVKSRLSEELSSLSQNWRD